jgi:predicted acylesterase/phospholipase RssA
VEGLITFVAGLSIGSTVGCAVYAVLTEYSKQQYEETIDVLFTELCESNREIYHLKKGAKERERDKI